MIPKFKVLDKRGRELEILTEKNQIYIRYYKKEWYVDVFRRGEMDTCDNMNFQILSNALEFVAGVI